MDNKMTRRVALGGIIGALAAGPFVMRAWRGNKRSPGPYDHFTVSPGMISSELSANEVQKAFDILQNERSRWQKFRGVAGNVSVKSQTSKKDSKNGYLTFQMEYVDTPGSRNGLRCPDNMVLTFSENEASSPQWTLRVNSQEAGPRTLRFEGKDVPGVDRRSLYHTLVNVVDAPNMTNLDFVDLMTGWRLVRMEDSPNLVYSLESNGVLFGSEGELPPTYVFTEGAICKYGFKTMPDTTRAVFTRENYENQHAFRFPKKIGYHLEQNGQALQTNDGQAMQAGAELPVAFSVEFTSLTVTTA